MFTKTEGNAHTSVIVAGPDSLHQCLEYSAIIENQGLLGAREAAGGGGEQGGPFGL